MPERDNSSGFDPDKLSGAFDRQQIYARRPIKSTWDNVYLQKQGQIPQVPEPIPDALTEKHFMYYHAFKNLGFFDLPNASQNPTILQAGVGHGKTLRTIVKEVEGVQPIGLDISLISLLKAQTGGLKNVVQGDILTLPFADDSIDGIFEVGVAEHLYTDDPFLGRIVDRQAIVESFQQLHRVLKPGGKVGFIQPSRHSTLPFSRKIAELNKKWDMGFQEDFGLNDFCQLVSLGGFNDIKFSILQAPSDFPVRIKVGDRLLKSYYTLTGQYRKAEMTGALFTVVASK